MVSKDPIMELPSTLLASIMNPLKVPPAVDFNSTSTWEPCATFLALSWKISYRFTTLQSQLYYFVVTIPWLHREHLRCSEVSVRGPESWSCTGWQGSRCRSPRRASWRRGSGRGGGGTVGTSSCPLLLHNNVFKSETQSSIVTPRAWWQTVTQSHRRPSHPSSIFHYYWRARVVQQSLRYSNTG